MANPTIFSAAFTPSRELIYVVPHKADGTTQIGDVSAAVATANLVIDGVDWPLGPPIWCTGWKGVAYPVGRYDLVSYAIDDQEGSGFSLSGTWAEVTPFAGVGGYFDENEAKNNQFHTSTDGTCTWFFPGLADGRFRASVHIHGLVGPDRSQHATYTVKDGSGKTLGTFTKDLTVRLYPGFDRLVGNSYMHDLGTVDLDPGQDTITVTLSNGTPGTGLIVADLVSLESVFVPPASPGDTVTATFSAGALTVDGVGTDAISGLAVTFETDDSFSFPILAPGDRTLKGGYNFDGIRENWFTVYLADRSLASDVWVGSGVTMDSHYEITANPSGSAQRTLLFWPISDGSQTPRGVYLMRPGTVRVRFRAVGVTFDAAARDACGLFNAFGGQYVVSPTKAWTQPDPTGQPDLWEMAQDVALPEWQPISARTQSFVSTWSHGLIFKAQVPGLLPQQWQWFDPDTPSGYAGTAHPTLVANLKGKCGPIRLMNWTGTNFSSAMNVGDWTTPDDRADPITGMSNPANADCAEFRIWTANVVSIRPADLNPATDTDNVYKYFDEDQFSAWLVVTVDDASAYPDGGIPFWRGATSVYPSTIAGVDVHIESCWLAYRIGSTNDILVKCSAQPDYTAQADGVYATIDATHSITGTILCINKNNQLTFESGIAVCADLEAEPWINIPHRATEAFVRDLCDKAVAGTPDGRRVHVEKSNEIWNAGYTQFHWWKSQWTHANYLHSVDPVHNPAYGSVGGYYAHRCNVDWQIFLDQWVNVHGRSASLVVRQLGGWTQFEGYQVGLLDQVASEAIAFDRLSLEGYQDSKPPGWDLSAADLAASCRRLSHDGQIDVTMISTFHGSRSLFIADADAKMAERGLAVRPKSAYEGGWSDFAPDGTARTSFLGISSPRVFRLEAARLSFMQSLGYAEVNKYVYAFNTMFGKHETWTDAYSATETPGTGDAGENASPYDYSARVSQPMGGRTAFNSGFDFSGAIATPTGVVALSVAGGVILIGLN